MANLPASSVPTNQLFQQRMVSKRQLTNIATRVQAMIARSAPHADCERELTLVNGVFERLQALNSEYIRRCNLDAQRVRNANDYVQQVTDFHRTVQQAVTNYVEPAAPAARENSWNVPDSVVNPVIRRHNWTVTSIETSNHSQEPSTTTNDTYRDAVGGAGGVNDDEERACLGAA